MSNIYQIKPSHVIHELILKSIGTYLIRYSTENDDIISQIRTKDEMKSDPYVVLSVRVDENQYYCPIMNYHLPLIGSDKEEILKYSLDHYRNSSNTNQLPELIEECVIKTEDTDWKIGPERFQTGYLAMYEENNGPLKADLKCDGNNRIKVVQKVMKNNEQELSILENLSYFHIVTFYGICYESIQKKYLILADHGESLKTKYHDIKYLGDLMSKQLAMIGYQIACGMMYLELKCIIHRDLHADNILIDEHDCIRIADFEHAIMKDDSQEFYEDREMGFKKRRLAPECLPSLPENGEFENSNEFSSKSDVWAYGLIFIDLTIDNHQHIYPDLPLLRDDVEETIQIIQYIKVAGEKHKRPKDCPPNLYNILIRCWEYKRDDRISFENLRNEMLQLFKSIHK
jgi:serine/threonine protein kinase